jgi:hypothetical protein
MGGEGGNYAKATSNRKLRTNQLLMNICSFHKRGQIEGVLQAKKY